MSNNEQAFRKSIHDDWDFRGEQTRDICHCIHDYPARMIPQIVRKLLSIYGNSRKQLFDPYCGTGTSLVEAQLLGLSAVGTDINPLARLISKVKTTPISIKVLDIHLRHFYNFLFEANFKGEPNKINVPSFPNIDFWFRSKVIRKLAYIKDYITNVQDKDVRDFFKVAFSETVRESSLTRNSEFKLFRIKEEKISAFDPDVYGIMQNKLFRNRDGFLSYMNALKSLSKIPTVSIYDFDTVESIPLLLARKKLDIVITSPPYGDSRTTVAYGQYSRLSSQWMDFEEANLVDKKLMGGRKSKDITLFDYKPLDRAIKKICNQDIDRALDIVSFYEDLRKSIDNVSSILRKNAYICYVVGNRRVKGVTLPTDEAIVSFFKKNKCSHVNTFVRSIPNKRMPIKTSPTNKVGKLDSTMTNEYIIVMTKTA